MSDSPTSAAGEPANGQGRALARLGTRVLFGLGVLFALDLEVRVKGPHGFIPDRRLADAVQAGDGCTVFTGGSDMVSAIDATVLLSEWQSGAKPCVANLAIGGASPDIRFMAFRKYLREGRKPAAVVIGFKGHALSDELELKPGYYVGNDAAVFEWADLADLGTYYPELSFAALDNSLRFLLFRATALGARRQSLWLKVDQLEQRLGLVHKSATNAFGNIDAFLELEAENRAAAAAASQSQRFVEWRVMRWTAALIALAARSGVSQVSFVRLPALQATERAYFYDASSERRFGDFVTELAQKYDGTYIDLSHAPWMQDSLLTDGLHYSASGAAEVSHAVGRALYEHQLGQPAAR
jgi:hypothetical protein